MRSQDKFIDQSKALAGEPRILILQWLKHPREHFSHQITGDPALIGVCVTLITEKLGMSQPTVSRHLDLLRQAGFLRAKKIGKWAFYSRDETAIDEYKAWLVEQV
ncbi:ArsR/SmtB family transcription factor [Pseudomonas capsici]|uniref:ArsR family transcriptional regulator n=1 Tax=Pseudomonas capsici TaxID=2810614 RepID=A0ABT3BZV1_9PSED|nr:metalloregulator ArsR/SmtB family transcription factor [Pseudomonas capsici]MBX8473541.1 ArsR family transcriptional regulator [Pseudomonas cichorii]MBN6715008.1 ArsR family transcriptional regulator [Pseudomonas capsici]MBN6720079.1 ArsR family transcriptional regulator [Pseudomonas capsici]MBN6724529.1 ArsR family transcriptional regulator [Pseudomonas capsici]MBX8610831.1 ArsR family transcriptional regulator [Pseudomonas cichorii]